MTPGVNDTENIKKKRGISMTTGLVSLFAHSRGHWRHALWLLGLGLSLGAQAKVSQEQAQRLNHDLTPVGAERYGNAAGTIPPWTGGITQPPEGYQKGMFHPDPFADDRILFTIDARNAEQYADKLSEGQLALLQQYAPGYVIHVYPSRRSASYPERIYQALASNALTAELQEHGTGVAKTIATSPFPIPANGLEVLWNHTLRYRGEQVVFRSSFVTPTQQGAYTPIETEYSYYFAYSQPGATLEEIDNKIFYLKTRVIQPAKLAGTINLVHETLDQVRSPRLAWRYQAGERPLRRSPSLAYDTDIPNGAGLRTVDQTDMYNGAPDQYEWELKGKREMYIPYNAYKLHSNNLKIADIIRPQHINQDLARYELHRVWVVEANLRLGLSHVYKKRRFYFDEDSWQIVLSEEYDKNDQLWRVSEAHLINYYEVPVPWTTLEVTYDLKSRRYFADGLDNEQSQAYDFSPTLDMRDFTTSSVRREATR